MGARSPDLLPLCARLFGSRRPHGRPSPFSRPDAVWAASLLGEVAQGVKRSPVVCSPGGATIVETSITIDFLARPLVCASSGRTRTSSFGRVTMNRQSYQAAPLVVRPARLPLL